MLFNFFKKTDDNLENSPNDILASITYIATKDSDAPIVDVEMKDYNDESIKALCSILDILAYDKSLIETVEIIKNAMINDGHEENLIKIFSHISKNTKSKMLQTYKNVEEDSPCIKPSEVFMTK